MDAINKLKQLQSQYPELVKQYPNIDEAQLLAGERILKQEVNKELKSLYRFTNGFGIMDYCLIGIGNKRIGDLVHLNFPPEGNVEDVPEGLKDKQDKGHKLFTHQHID